MGTVNKNALIRNNDVGFIKKRMACKNRTCDPQIDISAALPTELMSFSS